MTYYIRPVNHLTTDGSIKEIILARGGHHVTLLHCPLIVDAHPPTLTRALLFGNIEATAHGSFWGKNNGWHKQPNRFKDPSWIERADSLGLCESNNVIHIEFGQRFRDVRAY